ncbi:MAG: sulfur carrier protein ThiS [Rhodobacterales bacterium]|uniref:sulfur carrier protein ThiS n=1 Tax=unclassified Seohaeicola TaxID=2641111 RepID=UPI00237B2FFB|nr:MULTISPECIES: sulfur carrier protein ThiS [unclassified Seohaeicola]MDD9708612.1 sulfur carrier protein ThiS [Seohaeicola sp. 4SK31]MDD9736666.1 sulfur carrier protein ThiS [Seohaeicola sp. SP36]MDF1709304.1 sulfur carrier protein ThiS [Paracoccaceae bacterium]MDX5413241.1 sulfur carrier protein ThiS [Rhodobacterales bacterium]
MRIEVNGEAREVTATTLAAALDELGWGTAKVATALNGDFVPASARADQALRDGDRLEVLAPMQGG